MSINQFPEDLDVVLNKCFNNILSKQESDNYHHTEGLKNKYENFNLMVRRSYFIESIRNFFNFFKDSYDLLVEIDNLKCIKSNNRFYSFANSTFREKFIDYKRKDMPYWLAWVVFLKLGHLLFQTATEFSNFNRRT